MVVVVVVVEHVMVRKVGAWCGLHEQSKEMVEPLNRAVVKYSEKWKKLSSATYAHQFHVLCVYKITILSHSYAHQFHVLCVYKNTILSHSYAHLDASARDTLAPNTPPRKRAGMCTHMKVCRPEKRVATLTAATAHNAMNEYLLV